MRFQELDIDAFGRLEGMHVSLGPRVTVVLGANETGKSTLHRVLRAALFGIDAGGQGRPVERSEWMRWRPWHDASRYGFALTYRLDDGREYRVAARLGEREQQVQVVEVGGSDVTHQMRVGRRVAPGEHQLGVNEAVFCATAWLGDEGLRLGSAESAQARAEQLQQAIERLSDSGRGNASTSEAARRLRDALHRVGAERSAHTPLGAASVRLQQLEAEVQTARQRHRGYADDELRLRDLEDVAQQAAEHQVECERAWILGKLAALTGRRQELEHDLGELRRLERELAQSQDYADFPAENATAVTSLSGEFTQAQLVLEESSQRWRDAAERLRGTRRRRSEIQVGLEALGTPHPADRTILQRRDAVEAQIRDLGAERVAMRSNESTTARLDSLRREIATTGLGSIRVGSVDSLMPLIDTARSQNRSGLSDTAAAVLVGLGLAALAAGASLHRLAVGAAVLAVAVMLAAAGALLTRWRSAEARQALRQLEHLCPDCDLSPEGLDRLANRLPSLGDLHSDVQRQEALLQEQKEQADVVLQRQITVEARLQELEHDLGREAVVGTPSGDLGDRLQACQRRLRRLDEVLEESARVSELQAEDSMLAATEGELEQVATEATRATARVASLEQQIRELMGRAGADVSQPLTTSLTAYQRGCERRRRHDELQFQAETLRHGLPAAGATESNLDELMAELRRNLLERGGDVTAVARAEPLSEQQLLALEREVETSRQRASSAHSDASELRARLAGAREGLPALADLEDERSLVSGALSRGLHQRAALLRAAEMLERATRGVHRELAPRLASSIGRRLELLTDGRYREVNVDTAHFACSLLGVERPDLVPLDQVSHGTRDQVTLLMRIALAETLSSNGESVPLLLDEPLLSSDPHRHALAIDFLVRLSEQHQLLLTTSDPAVASSMCKRLGDDALVVNLSHREDLQLRGTEIGRSLPVD